jgi:hypothetical protein
MMPHPAFQMGVKACAESQAVNDPIKPNLHAFFMLIVGAKIRTTLKHVPAAMILSFSHEFGGFLRAGRPRAGRLRGNCLFGVDRFSRSLHNAALKSVELPAEMFPS